MSTDSYRIEKLVEFADGIVRNALAVRGQVLRVGVDPDSKSEADKLIDKSVYELGMLKTCLGSRVFPPGTYLGIITDVRVGKTHTREMPMLTVEVSLGESEGYKVYKHFVEEAYGDGLLPTRPIDMLYEVMGTTDLLNAQVNVDLTIRVYNGHYHNRVEAVYPPTS